jgi:hypothetical protein
MCVGAGPRACPVRPAWAGTGACPYIGRRPRLASCFLGAPPRRRVSKGWWRALVAGTCRLPFGFLLFFSGLIIDEALHG